eukprot:245443_1
MAEQVSAKEDDIRASWKVGSVVEIFSSSSKQWHKGTVMKILNDEEGEWLEVQYEANNMKRVKQTPREDADTIRAIKQVVSDDHEEKQANEDGQEKTKITLLVKTISNEKYAICVENDCLVSDLKKEIQQKTEDKIDPLLQRLLWHGKQLDDELRINDPSLASPITNHCNLILVKESAKQMTITLKTLDSKKHKLEINSMNTIAHIKELAHKQLNFGTPDALILMYNGKMLRDDQTVKSADIKETGYIIVTVRKNK